MRRDPGTCSSRFRPPRCRPLAALAVLLLVGLLSSSALAADEERPGCTVCGMYLDAYAATSHVVIFKDGRREATCSLACAAKILARDKEAVSEILAADFPTGKLVPADQAFYLEGSDIPGVMSYTSRVAFRSRIEAVGFQKEHGGRIVSFREALEHQTKE